MSRVWLLCALLVGGTGTALAQGAPPTKAASGKPPAPTAAATKPALPAGATSDDAIVQAPGDPGAPRPEPPAQPADRLAWLRTQLDTLLADGALNGARVGVEVAEIESGKILYGRNETTLFNPASNVKLFTTAAALALLGPEYRWKTVAFADGPVQAGEVKGRLYLKGHGDPTLVVEDLWRIVADLWAAGVRKVSGDLVVDDSFFDAVRVGPGFDQKQEDAA